MKRSAAFTIFFAMLLYCLPSFAGDLIHISTLVELQNIQQDAPYNHYILDNDIDAMETATWNGGAGFVPIGIPGNPFHGTFDGNGFVIKRLTINRPNEDFVGLFGVVRGATIRNIGLTECNITGQSNVGALLGAGGNSEKIDKCYSSGSVSATGGPAGGLVGSNSAYIKQSYSSADVTAQNGDRIGGLIGKAVFISKGHVCRLGF